MCIRLCPDRNSTVHPLAISLSQGTYASETPLSSEMYLVPVFLNVDASSNFISTLTSIISNHTMHLYYRLFQFLFLPLGFFERLLVSLVHLLHARCISVWAGGAILEQSLHLEGYTMEQIAVLFYDKEHYRLYVLFACEGSRVIENISYSAFNLLTLLIQTITELITRFDFVSFVHAYFPVLSFPLLFLFTFLL
jgi:hypothetical protein